MMAKRALVLIVLVVTLMAITSTAQAATWGPFRVRFGSANAVQKLVDYRGGAHYWAIFRSRSTAQRFMRRYNPSRLKGILDRYSHRCGIHSARVGRGQVWENLPLRRSIGSCQKRRHRRQ